MSDDKSAQPVTSDPVPESSAATDAPATSEVATGVEGAKVDNGSEKAPAKGDNGATPPPAIADGETAPETEEKIEAAAGDGAATKETATDAPSATTPAKGRRKSGGAPDTKGRKLNKKQSKAKLLRLDAKPGELYLVKLKGYPIWPAIICDEEILPENLSVGRPVTAARPDGTYRADYADGGKNVGDRTFPVMYLYTNEFGWVPNYDLLDYTPDSAPDLSRARKDLYQAYLLAGEGHDLDYYKNVIREHKEAQEKQAQEKAAKKAEKEAKKAGKGKRKSTATVAADDDDVEMPDADVVAGDDGEAATETPKPKTKKRKAAAVEEGDVATPNTESAKKPKIKLTNKAANGTSTPKSASKKDDTPAKAAKPKVKKPAAKTEKAETPAEPQMSAQEKQLKKEKEILFLRHKLQKGLLTRDQTPKPEEMKQMSEYITKLEGYADLEVAIIRQTKINKVLKAIKKLEVIPKEEEFHFKARSDTLLAKWNKLLESQTDSPAPAAANGTTNGESKANSEQPKADAEKTNGVKEEKEKTEDKPETTEAASKEAPAVEASA